MLAAATNQLESQNAATDLFHNTWIGLKRIGNTPSRLNDYWVYGKSDKPAAPSWSVIRDVLHWVE